MKAPPTRQEAYSAGLPPPATPPRSPETTYFEMADLVRRPGLVVILRSSDGGEVTATFKRSRRFEDGRWRPYEVWIADHRPIEFEPAAWRHWP
jgi:hypothetical protein